MASELEGVLASAEHRMKAARAQHYRVRASDGGLAISEQGDPLALAASALEARDTIHERSHRRAFELAELKGWLMLRGALVDVNGRRLLLLGPPGAGKTILTVRLGLAGAAIQGDDRVLVRERQLLAVPRPLALAEDAGDLVPELAGLAPALPRAGRLAMLDPARDLGLPWRLRIAPVDHVVELERGTSQAECTPCPPGDLLGALAAALGPAGESTPELLAVCSALMQSAAAHRLTVCDPSTAERALRALAC